MVAPTRGIGELRGMMEAEGTKALHACHDQEDTRHQPAMSCRVLSSADQFPPRRPALEGCRFTSTVLQRHRLDNGPTASHGVGVPEPSTTSPAAPQGVHDASALAPCHRRSTPLYR